MFKFLANVSSWLIGLNLFVLFAIANLVWAISNFYFGIATLFLSLLVVLTTPVLSAKVFGNDFSLRLPIFPGASLLRLALGATLVAAVAFSLMGSSDLVDSLKIARDRQKAEIRIYSILAGKYFCENNKSLIFVGKTTGIFLKEERNDTNGLKLLKFSLKSKYGFDGPVVWVPILRTQKIANVVAVKKKGDNPPVAKKGLAIATSKTSRTSRVFILKPEEIYQQDLYGGSAEKTKLRIEGFKKGDEVAFQEDFCIFRSGGPSKPETFIWVNNHQKKQFSGNCIPKGVRFQVRDNELVLYILAYKAKKVSFSRLALKKVN